MEEQSIRNALVELHRVGYIQYELTRHELNTLAQESIFSRMLQVGLLYNVNYE